VTWLTLWRPLVPYGHSYKASCARPDLAVICNFWHLQALWRSGLTARVPADVKNYKWQLNLVWHRMLFSCAHMARVGVRGLMFVLYLRVYNIVLYCVWWLCAACEVRVCWGMWPRSCLCPRGPLTTWHLVMVCWVKSPTMSAFVTPARSPTLPLLFDVSSSLIVLTESDSDQHWPVVIRRASLVLHCSSASILKFILSQIYKAQFTQLSVLEVTGLLKVMSLNLTMSKLMFNGDVGMS